MFDVFVGLNWSLFMVYIIGQAIHICFFDIPHNRNLAKVANVNFKALNIVKNDLSLWIGNMLLGILILILFDELKLINKRIGAYPKITFALMGGFFSFAIQAKWGRIQKQIEKIIDKKTDIADAILGKPFKENV